MIAGCGLTVLAVAGYAQGTADDYLRAYSLREKFAARQVTGWANDVAWHDSVTFCYSKYTAEGQQFVVGDAMAGTLTAYSTRDDMNRRLGIVPPPPRREDTETVHRKRHWMEVDEEQSHRGVKSPDGRWEARIEGYNVVLYGKGQQHGHGSRQQHGEKRILSQDGTIGDYYSDRLLWSPDSRYLFVCKRQPVEKRYVHYVEAAPDQGLQPQLHRQEYAKPGDRLPQKTPVIFDVQSGKRLQAANRDLCDEQYSLDNFTWRPDSREVLMEYNRRGHKVVRILAMSAATGTLRTVVEETSTTFVNYTRYFRHDCRDGKRLIWMSERDNWNHLYLYDIDKARPLRQITKGEWCVREVLRVDEAQGTVYFSASGMNKDEDPYLVRYYSIGTDGSRLTCLTPAEGNHRAVFSPGYRYLIDTYSTVDRAPVTELRTADGRLLQTLERADISRLEAVGWRAPEVFVAKGRDGLTDMWGIIQRPTTFDPSRSYPVIEYIYAGPGSAYTPKSFIPYNHDMTSLAELGFIVVQLDAMGTSWRGKRFEEVCHKNLKDAGFPDRIAWMKAAAARYPYMDISRVGIFGASAGGQESTAAVLFHGDFYKAAYSACGCHDNRMDKIWWNEQWMGYPVDSSYVACSNVENAYRLNRPLMLVVGELDDNVDPASTMQLAAALIKAGKDFELVVLPGVHHTMGGDYGEHKRYDFFVRHLLGTLPPAWQAVAGNDGGEMKMK